MISQEEKLSKFLEAINNYAQEQRQRILAELDARNRAALELAEKETLSDAYRMINQETADVRNSISREVATFELESRKKLLARRGEIEKQVFTKAAERLSGFTHTAEYDRWLEKEAKAVASRFGNGGSTTVRLRSADSSKIELIRCAFGYECTFETDDTIQLGGFIAINSELARVADCTLDAALDSQHDWFAENSGLSVS